MYQSSTINGHLLQIQTSFRCKASLKISQESRLSCLLSGSSHFTACSEMAWEQIPLAVPILLLLHFLSVKPNPWKLTYKERKIKITDVIQCKNVFHADMLPTVSSFWEFTLEYVHGACAPLIGTVRFRLVRLLSRFSRKKSFKLLCSEVRLTSGSQRKPPAALQTKPPAQPHCRRYSLTGQGSWRPGYETEGLEFFPAPVCLWLFYGN